MGQVIQLYIKEKAFPFSNLTATVMAERGYGKNARHKNTDLTVTPDDEAIETFTSQE